MQGRLRSEVIRAMARAYSVSAGSHLDDLAAGEPYAAACLFISCACMLSCASKLLGSIRMHVRLTCTVTNSTHANQPTAQVRAGTTTCTHQAPAADARLLIQS
eukprot:6199162-Pleurochrysis_carterae.AAC.1